ncbi:MAG: hypothetical protein H0W72_07890 [Planctomycetes bacterium]|nr:hypothetical protein [Planctomycetota bacterium]
MSCVIVLTPVVIASWPTIAASVAVVAAAMGYTQVAESIREKQFAGGTCVDIEVDHVDAVADTMGRDQSIVIERQGVRVTFSKDARGRFKTAVHGSLAKAELAAIGREISQRVVQQYVYRRLADELGAQGFVTVHEEQAPDQTIKLHVKRFGG